MDDWFTILVWLVVAFTLCMGIFKVWGDSIYLLMKNWRVAMAFSFVVVLVSLLSLKHENLQYSMANYVYHTQEPDNQKLASTIEQCKSFVQAKLDGQNTKEYRTISAGFVDISSISYWEICANTFGMNYWKHDISINGQDGGRLLCDAYVRAPYRSGKVNAWCDTVFAPDQRV